LNLNLFNGNTFNNNEQYQYYNNT